MASRNGTRRQLLVADAEHEIVVQRLEQRGLRRGIGHVEIEAAHRRGHVAAEFLAVNYAVRISLSRCGGQCWKKAGLRAIGRLGMPPMILNERHPADVHSAREAADKCRRARLPGARVTMDRFNLGVHTRRVRTSSAEAQRWFDLGLNWCFGFNQEEGREVLPQGARVRSGLRHGALGHRLRLGAFLQPCLARLRQGRGRSLRQGCLRSPADRSRAESPGRKMPNATWSRRCPVASRSRTASAPRRFDQWDDDYAAAMRRVHHAFPDDHDIMALLVEALITRTPRRLWDVKTGAPSPQRRHPGSRSPSASVRWR